MAYDALTTAETASGEPITQALWRKVKDNFEYMYGVLAGVAGNSGVPNGSFEVDSDSDDIPDSWSRTLYSGGAAGFYTSSPADGAQSYYFTHPGGGGNGGGYIESDYIEVTEFCQYIFQFIHWATAAGMKNVVQARWFTAAQVYISSTDLYNSTSNPTSASMFGAAAVPPSTARYCKIRVVGGYTDTDVAGTAYFDGFALSRGILTSPGDYLDANAASDTEEYSNPASYTKIKEIVVPYGGSLRIKFDMHTESGGTAYGKIYRNAVAVGTERSTSNTGYVTYSEDIAGWKTGDLLQLYIYANPTGFDTYVQNFRAYTQYPVNAIVND